MLCLNTPEEIRQGYDVARAYTQGDLRGWNSAMAAEAFNLFGSKYPAFKILNQTRPTDGQKRMLYDITRKVLGKDTPNYPQQIGDCVSFGAKNATEYITATDILMGKREKWRPIFPPYYYGTSRVQIGGEHSMSDGSTGAWAAEAAQKYGGLFADEQGVPSYSAKVAKDWGYSGPPDNFLTIGKQHLVHSCAVIKSFSDLVAAIVNGYPCTTASDIGYEMEASSDGFHHRSGSWSHQMCFIGVGFAPEPYAIILNNWGDCHGHLTDFDDKSITLPIGVLRVRQKDAESHINAGETYAWSQFDGFPQQAIDEALFKVIGG